MNKIHLTSQDRIALRIPKEKYRKHPEYYCERCGIVLRKNEEQFCKECYTIVQYWLKYRKLIIPLYDSGKGRTWFKRENNKSIEVTEEVNKMIKAIEIARQTYEGYPNNISSSVVSSY